MNSPVAHARPRTVGFDERLAVLVDELGLAVKWQRPCILLAVYNTDFVRGDAETALKTRLLDLRQKRVQLSLENRKPAELPDLFKQFKNPRSTVFEVDGFRHANDDATGIFAALNQQREYFVERRIRMILWLTENELAGLAHAVPEFWAHRDRVIEFIQMPKAEEVQPAAADSAQRGIDPPADNYKLPDAGIPKREALQPVFAREEEGLVARGHLLRSAAIESRNKGDLTKADELMQEAVKIAAKLHDNALQAECLNALASLRGSAGRIDEAIDACKRATQLAPNQGSAWNNLGTLCAVSGRKDEAMIAFRKALQIDPKDGAAWNGLAGVHLGLGYHEDAIVAYRKAIQYTPKSAEPWCGLGDAFASLGRSDEAEKSYHKAIDLDKNSAAPWIRLAALFKRQASYAEATTAYERALELEPGNADTWNGLGTGQMEAGSLDKAAEAFSKAIELDRGNGTAYGNLAITYTRQNKHKEAVSLLLRSIELLENNADKGAAWNQLAGVYRALNDYDNAAAAYQMADEFGTLDEAMIETPVQPPAEAEQAAGEPQAASEASPEPAAASAEAPAVSEPVVSSDAAVSVGSGHGGEAANIEGGQKALDAPAWLFERTVASPASMSEGDAQPGIVAPTPEPQLPEGQTPAITAEPPEIAAIGESAEQPAENLDAPAWTERGNSLFNSGAFEKAISAYKAAIELDPAYGPAYGNLALACLTKGESAEAILLYQKSIELLTSDTDKAISWNGLGNAYRRIGDYAHAISAYQTAAELDPETSGIRDRADDFESRETKRDAQAWIDLGDVLLKTGSPDKAADAFRRAIELGPQTGTAYSGLARTLAAQGKHTEAVPFFQRSIELLTDGKDKADALNGLGSSYRRLNDYASAIRSYQKAVDLADDGVNLLTRARFSLLSNVYVNP